MSCCGRGTTTPGGTTSSPPRRLHGRRGPRPAGTDAVYLRYTGPTHLTARGPFSGRSYRFGAPGAMLPVDPRDLTSLAAVPALERVASPPRGTGAR